MLKLKLQKINKQELAKLQMTVNEYCSVFLGDMKMREITERRKQLQAELYITDDELMYLVEHVWK